MFMYNMRIANYSEIRHNKTVCIIQIALKFLCWILV